jgi:hypothetical protein
MLPLEELTSFFPIELLDRLAVAFRVNRANQIRLPGQAVFLCLLHGLLPHPELTQQRLADLYTQQTGQTVCRSSFSKRLLTLPAAYFAALAQHLFRQLQPQLRSGEPPGLRLRIADATVVSLSAKLLQFGLLLGTRAGKQSWRQVQTVWELSADGLPQLLRVCRKQKEAKGTQ